MIRRFDDDIKIFHFLRSFQKDHFLKAFFLYIVSRYFKMYSGTRNDVDTTAVFTAVFEGFMTLRANNFSSGGTLVMFLVFI